MTKGGSSKPTMLGRLIFGEKRKQHASPSRHRSATRNGGTVADVSSSSGGNANKNLINLHDWAVWRMHLNEQMGNGMTERTDLKHMRQFLHSNPFYQQHSRDPSSGRYNGVQLLFSIPHAKLKPELIDGSRGGLYKNTNMDIGDTTTYDQNNVLSNSDDRTTTSVNSVSAGSPMVIDKTINQLLPKGLIGNAGNFIPTIEPMSAVDIARTRRSIRTPYTASDRVHSTLQKAVKDGNVLEKIKAFEMQAAAAQAESTTKLGGCGGGSSVGINHRMQSIASSIQSAAAYRTLSPAMIHPMQHPISPIPIQHEPQQQYIRSHRSRHIYPTQPRHDGNLGNMIGRQSRKGAHVLEPALGDIILKRRTPSQKTINDEDYSVTAISPMALPVSQGHNHRQHHYHHRTSTSRSRHRKETVHEKHTSHSHENVHKKSQQKQKETTISATSTKTSTRHRWLKGHKDKPSETVTEKVKQDTSTNKSNKKNKTKKKNTEQEKVDSKNQMKSSISKGKILSDNNRVYGVPNTTVNEQTKFETISPQPPSRIDEENESDREEENIENQHSHISTKQEGNLVQPKQCDTTVEINGERSPNKTQYQQKLSCNDGEILSKIEDDTRFSRPTDDHAHRSELIDEDDECKSEGDVFIEESSLTNMNSPQQQQQQLSTNAIRRHSSQRSVEKTPSDRRWQWSKESGGLIDKGNRKKKQQQQSTTNLSSKDKIIPDEEQVVYETPQSEQIQTLNKKQSLPTTTTTENSDEQNNNNKQISKQILHAILNSMTNNQEQTTMDEFFENGPYTNPEETLTNITSTA
ncbi:unnamed protein product [Rotaria sp. Silwood2]|nr:unnamed protein product [Rotaria sp. Silwood2]CAF2528273.1 unnamed protein product [Rotaria sp. Silwood2]CAF2785589.1 unnamed protein product [Rotaria sp. Silwood2]CAF2938514.1 unnamed protein product [Rotaria sp. Silwood2]CAF3856782.1 unnamed protein product [Rotaria sp. Silwood2]